MSDRPSASNIAIEGSGAQTSILFQAPQAPSPCDFKVALKVGLRCLLRSADPACNTAATCRPCRPAASVRTLQQACRPCSSLMQQACRPMQQAYSCRVCRLSASLQTLQQPAGQQRLRATCKAGFRLGCNFIKTGTTWYNLLADRLRPADKSENQRTSQKHQQPRQRKMDSKRVVLEAMAPNTPRPTTRMCCSGELQTIQRLMTLDTVFEATLDCSQPK